LVPTDRSEEFGVAGAHFKLFLTSFYVLIKKKHVLTVSHMTVTLQIKQAEVTVPIAESSKKWRQSSSK
jgi:hypothetical protein